jgi:hypothetical protein
MDPQNRINQTVSLEDVWNLLQEINDRLKTIETAALPPEMGTTRSMGDELVQQHPSRSYATLADAIAAAEAQNTPEYRERFRQACKCAHGVLKDSKAWGQCVDVVAEISKLRDEEWPNLWENDKTRETIRDPESYIQAEAAGE